MTLEHTRSRIIDLWIAEKNSVDLENYAAFFQLARTFYEKLKRCHAELLSFEYLGDKWQVINQWIHDYENDVR